MVVYVVNPRVTRHYREALSLRGHTDRLDARTILSFITHHHQSMRVYAPKTAEQTRLASLVRRRAKLSALQVQMKQSLQGIPELRSHLLGLTGRIDRMIAAIDLLIDKQLDGSQDRARLESIKGVGPVVSAALLADLAAGEFRNADAFVAFYGLDPAPNDSGRSKGKRKISKKGHRLGRSMLYVAALSASCSKAWKPLYERFLAKGLSRVQALVCLARRIARAAWSIYTHKTTFDPKRITAAA
jgi:transposase